MNELENILNEPIESIYDNRLAILLHIMFSALQNWSLKTDKNVDYLLAKQAFLSHKRIVDLGEDDVVDTLLANYPFTRDLLI